MMGSDTRAVGRFVDVFRGFSDAENIGYVSYLHQPHFTTHSVVIEKPTVCIPGREGYHQMLVLRCGEINVVGVGK